jgi:methyl-accepting chemotaxis protein
VNVRQRIKALAVVTPLAFATVVIAFTAALGVRAKVAELTKTAEKALPLGSVVSSVTENQLEQAIWFERALAYASAGSPAELSRAATEFGRLNDEVVSDLSRGITIAEEGMTASRRTASQEKFRQIKRSLEETLTQRELYEQTALRILDLLQEPGTADSRADRVDRPLAAVRELEDLLHDELESVRSDLARTIEKAIAELLKIGRLAMVFIIVGMILLLAGLVAAALILRSWKSESDKQRRAIPTGFD